MVQEDRLGFAPTYAGALSELFDITFEEARILVGETTAPPVNGATATEPSGPSGSLDLGEVGPEVAQRLDDILGKFAEAEEALPDFAEFERLQSEARDELEELLGEVEAGDTTLPDEEPDSA